MSRKRNVDLEAEMGADIDLTEEEANDARTIVPAPQPVVAAQPLTLTIDDIKQLVATAISASQQGNANLADIVTQGIAQARKPIPEGTDASNPRISDRNPLGERDHPLPLLKCEFFLGTQDNDGKITRTYPYEHGDLTVHEILALNTLQPCVTSIRLHDGAAIKVNVVQERDGATDKLRRMVIVLPTAVTEKKSAIKNMLPGPCNLVAQITGAPDVSRLNGAALAEVMAAHRRGEYITEPEKAVA